MSSESETEHCPPGLRSARIPRGSTDSQPDDFSYDKKTNSAIEARYGKATSDLPTIKPAARDPWDR